MIECRWQGDPNVIFRPAGTEPKVKAYLFSFEKTREEAEAHLTVLSAAAEKLLK